MSDGNSDPLTMVRDLCRLVEGPSFPGRQHKLRHDLHNLYLALHDQLIWTMPAPEPFGQFSVFGNPLPKERPRVTVSRAGAHAYTPLRTKHWEAQVRDAARAAMAGRPPLPGSVAVELWLWRGDRRRVDADNCEKALLDACNEVIWNDDVQVLDMHRYKRLDRDNPRAEMRVWALEDVEW